MNNCFIILAAGKSKRFNSKTPKTYSFYKGKPLIMHSIDKATKSKFFNKIVVVFNKNHKKYIDKLINKDIKFVEGGKTRADSSFNALKSLKNLKIQNVLIHDAARPHFSLKLLNTLLKGLKKNKSVIPAIKVNDSVKLKKKNEYLNLKRENIYLTQTPQAFDFKELFKLQKNKDKEITDDASLVILAKKKIKMIKGELGNRKITFKNDLNIDNSIKYGIGFDVHRLVPNKKLYLGGLNIPSQVGTLGHSDGDPVLHAVTDAILGACKEGDIGEKFSDNSKKFKNIRSTILLDRVVREIKSKGFIINNIDINIIVQKPKIQKFKKKIIKCISRLCRISSTQINLKGKTTEKLGVIGKEKAIACEVIASVFKYD